MKKFTYIFMLAGLLLTGSVLTTGMVSAAGAAASSTTAVDINIASAKQISESLNGIGLKKAQAIVDYRQNNGKFADIKDLLKIKGIGPKILLKNEALITVKSDK